MLTLEDSHDADVPMWIASYVDARSWNRLQLLFPVLDDLKYDLQSNPVQFIKQFEQSFILPKQKYTSSAKLLIHMALFPNSLLQSLSFFTSEVLAITHADVKRSFCNILIYTHYYTQEPIRYIQNISKEDKVIRIIYPSSPQVLEKVLVDAVTIPIHHISLLVQE